MKKALLLLALTTLLGAAAAAYWAWQRLQAPFGEVGEVEIEVPAGQSGATILRRLQEAGVVWNAELARLYLVYRLGDPALKAGKYRIPTPARLDDVIEKLERGEVVLETVTVIEGLTAEETAERLAARGFGDRDLLVAEMRSPDRIADLDPEATDLEGYLLPETYSFPADVTEAEIVDAMVAGFRRQWERQKDTLAIGIREWVTLASIVEKEAQLDEERPIIAGVYRNRLDRGIALYADPTIIFALKRLGRWDGNLRRRDLTMDDPYNTYKYGGLPPGPICSPGAASLAAARAPAEVPYLYFVSRNDGSHVFAETLREHNRNVDEWQRRYWRERRQREQEAAESTGGG